MEKIVRIGQVPREPQYRGGGVGGHALGHGPGGEGLYIEITKYFSTDLADAQPRSAITSPRLWPGLTSFCVTAEESWPLLSTPDT